MEVLGLSFEIAAGSVIEPGTYKAQLQRTEVKNGGKFGDGTFRIWHWIVDVDGEAVELSDSTSNATGPQSKAFTRLIALLGRTPQAGEKIEDPTGKTVVLTIGRKENGFPKVEAVGAYVDPQQTVEGLPK